MLLPFRVSIIVNYHIELFSSHISYGKLIPMGGVIKLTPLGMISNVMLT